MGRFTATCNLTFTNYILDTFSSHSQVDMIYTNFTKVFDHVNHHALVKTLRSLGFGESLVSWFYFYFFNRKQNFQISGFYSESADITFGVPQSGYLFLIFFPYLLMVSKML